MNRLRGLVCLPVFWSLLLAFALFHVPLQHSQAVTLQQDIVLTWTAGVPLGTGVMVERKIGPAGVYAQVGPLLAANALTFTDPNVAQGSSFCYRVTQTSTIGNGLPTPDFCIATAGVPGTPGGLTGSILLR